MSHKAYLEKGQQLVTSGNVGGDVFSQANATFVREIDHVLSLSSIRLSAAEESPAFLDEAIEALLEKHAHQIHAVTHLDLSAKARRTAPIQARDPRFVLGLLSLVREALLVKLGKPVVIAGQ